MAKDEKKYKRKKKLGSYQYGSVLFSITLTLIVVGLFGALLFWTNQITTRIKENIELQVYLNKNVTVNQRSRIQNDLSARPFTLKRDEIPQIRFSSKEEAAAKFIEDTGEDFTEFLGENPLRDALIINIAPDFQTNQKLDSLATSIEGISGVFEVTYVESLVDSINKNMTTITVVLLVIAAFLMIVVVMLIYNTIKLALFSQRFLIRSMQLVGATRTFIKRPFLGRAIGHGMLAGLLASGLLYGFFELAMNRLEQLRELQEEVFTFALFGALVVLGGIIALISTYRAMNKYLKMSLDDLY